MTATVLPRASCPHFLHSGILSDRQMLQLLCSQLIVYGRLASPLLLHVLC